MCDVLCTKMTRMHHFFLFSILLISSVKFTVSEESAQYLENAISDLRRNMKSRQTLKRVDLPDTPEPIAPQENIRTVNERRSQHQSSSGGDAAPPPLSLTKGELAALYEAAIAKGETVKLDTGENSYIHAAVHELDENSESYIHEKPGTSEDNDNNPNTGYYYYYYPIKSFLDEMTSQASNNYGWKSHKSEVGHSSTTKPHYQYHSHTHQHNVKITKEAEVKKEKKGLEPLFMAISGFVGMALMFVLSIVFFPKFNVKKSIRSDLKKNERITDIARVALQAIEGRDCAERFACELEKTSRTFNLQDNRFVKLLKRIAPFGRQMQRASASKKLRCRAIPCKKKLERKPNPPKKKNQKKH